MNHDLGSIARTLVASGKGILAADETPSTLTKRFEAPGIQSTEQSRRAYREMLFTPAGMAEFISGRSASLTAARSRIRRSWPGMDRTRI